MTPIELRAAIAELGLTQAEFAALCGVRRRTVVRWLCGEAPVPAIVASFIMLLDAKRCSIAGSILIAEAKERAEY